MLYHQHHCLAFCVVCQSESYVLQLSQALLRESEALTAGSIASQQCQELAERLEDVSQTLSQEQDLRKTVTAEASVKAARLARLEGKLCH